MKKWIVVLFGAWVVLAHADDSPWRVYAAGGISTGGDTVFEGTIVEDGTNYRHPVEIRAATGTPVRLGAEYRFGSLFALRANVGRLVSDPMGYNGTMSFTSKSTELLGFFSLGNAFRLGAGLRQSTGELEGSGVVADYPLIGHYASTGGSVVEAQYLFSNDADRSQSRQPQVGLTLRIVNETFESNGMSFNGDHYEVGLALYF